MHARRLFAAALLVGCAACAPFRELPPGDPLWVATSGGANPFVIDPPRPGSFPKASTNQKAATERARLFVGRFLPADSALLVKSLERENFTCGIYGGGVGWECTYSKAHPPAPCATSLRVSVELNFPDENNRSITNDDVDVAALVVADPNEVDERGCFPL